ncbi:hypothetical protein [Streptomyces ortus]|uniref:Sigma-70 family RNA polymerase sigma factor n=1 Tax=Streptomyces ortus TaxID=2867268 RepID=A0ABT3UWW7_9ACTN|nr:hypothetical protein [Streptomyces ortus]MCX4232057.1 hypothetical protein [Streptomyces ortus]
MTESPEATVDVLVTQLDDIADPAERFQATRDVEKHFDAAVKVIRQRIALQLKDQMTWRQVGEVMGGVSAQRAEQVSRGA